MSADGKATIKVDVDLPAAGKKRLNDKVRLFAANTAFKLMDPYVPMDTGLLSKTVDIEPGEVHYKQPYAQVQHDNMSYKHKLDKHPLATAKWDEHMMTARKDDLSKAITAYIKRGYR